VGAITEAFVDTYEGRDVIMGRAFIWKDQYPAVYDLLKTRADENEFIGTSWEVYYTSAEEVNGINWLKDVVFAGTCIVDNPAYGNRTPLLSVAEEKEKMEELKKQIEELTAALAEKEKEANDLRTKVQAFEEAEQHAKAEARKNEVIAELSSVFGQSEIEQKLEFYLSLSDDVLKKIIGDLQKAAPTSKSTSSTKEPISIPEPQSSTTDAVSPKALADFLKKNPKV